MCRFMIEVDKLEEIDGLVLLWVGNELILGGGF